MADTFAELMSGAGDMAGGPRVLVIEDDLASAAALAEGLRAEGFVAWVAHSGEEALEAWQERQPDAVLLDLALPDMDGLDVCRAIRVGDVVPLIIATGRVGESDRVCGLEMGADDYVCKPVDPREVAARLRALLSRCRRYSGLAPSPDAVVELGDLMLDPEGRQVTLRGQPVMLTPKEFDLLWALAREADRTVSSRRLLWEVWGYDEHIRTRTLDVHIGRLRRKLGDGAGAARLIVTVPSMGYRLETPALGAKAAA
jgi:DNA-binding response OmpR family regulator